MPETLQSVYDLYGARRAGLLPWQWWFLNTPLRYAQGRPSHGTVENGERRIREYSRQPGFLIKATEVEFLSPRQAAEGEAALSPGEDDPVGQAA